ncbi:TetR family transcriptional regulator C-terminal domain-containing protein [Nocardioides sp. C4-1]|uniref:TetR/AcrR family transcriptional regulator n=1 Tax=Nocardioides sp. C4-1 TaxID=3151851 RepID=UPI0032661D06
MPRLIDHDARRAELAEAVWRVITRDGVGRVSVRTVAAEAGVSAGSLRHVLPSKGLMLAAAMDLVVARTTERFLAHPPGVRTRAGARRMLAELLPLDDERRLEMQVHLALAAEAVGHPELDGVRAAPDDAVRQACRTVLELADAGGHLHPGLDLGAETTRLHVLVDGLALHLLGGALSTRQADRLLDEHLAARWRTAP